MVAAYELGKYEMSKVHDTLTFLIESDRNLEAHENIKALEGLRENKTEAIIEYLQVRVASALKMNGTEAKTIERAAKYQEKYCENACLGVEW